MMSKAVIFHPIYEVAAKGILPSIVLQWKVIQLKQQLFRLLSYIHKGTNK